jgi:flagellar biosynthetic protein FliP
MTPTIQRVSHDALDPYSRGSISQSTMLVRAFEPLRSFMLRQTHVKDLELFERLAHVSVARAEAAPPDVLLPAFVVGELRSAFAIGFALYLPFVAIDLAVASILMGLGMFMLSPPIVSLPCKLLLFVMVDGWALVCSGIVSTFR